jgi:hypothetical protein
MAEEMADGRRPSMYDPARDIFAKEQKDDGSAERGTTQDTSARQEGKAAANVPTSTAISQAIPGSHYDRFPVSNPRCQPEKVINDLRAFSECGSRQDAFCSIRPY